MEIRLNPAGSAEKPKLCINPSLYCKVLQNIEPGPHIEVVIAKPLHYNTSRAKSMKILFSNPPWFADQGTRWGVRAGSRWPFTAPAGCGYYPYPFLMGYAVSWLRKHGIDAHMADSILSRETLHSYLTRLKELKFDWVVMETSSASIDNDLKIAKQAARYAKIALCGPHATTFAGELIKIPFIKAVLRGEYENASLALAVTGEEKIYDYNIIPDIDILPYPYRDYTVYQYMDAFKVTPKGPQLQMWGSRGCPYGCIFCLWPPVMYNGRTYRPRSAENIIKEAEFTLKNFPLIKSIYFDDDTFNIGDERVREIARGMKNLKVPWQAMCRADTSSLETFEIMAGCGCTAVKLGVESGSPRMIEACKKNLDLNAVREAVSFLKKKGVFVHLTFTFGIPGETAEDRAMTETFIKEVKPDSIQTSGCTPFPGTELWRQTGCEEKEMDFASLDGQKKIELLKNNL